MAQGLKLRQTGTRESLEASISKFGEALEIIRLLQDRPLEANILFIVGSTYNQLGESQKALGTYLDALALFRTTNNSKNEATTLNNIGEIYANSNEENTAIGYYTNALSLRQTLNDQKGAAVVQNNLGLAYSALGQPEKALRSFTEAYTLSQKAGDLTGEATALSNIGVLYGLIGEQAKSIENLIKALPLRQKVGDHEGEAATLLGLGEAYSSIDEKQKALDFYMDSLSIAEANGARKAESIALNNIGELYDSVGETESALDFLLRASLLKRTIGDSNGEAVTLGNIGNLYRRINENEKALEYFNRALESFLANGNQKGAARMYNNIGSVSKSAHKQDALDHYKKALALSRTIGDHSTEAAALNNIAGILEDSGGKEDALAYYEQALSLLRDLGDRRHEAGTLSNIASLQRGQGHLKEALTNINSSIDIIESLRTKIVVPNSRSTFFASVHNHYEFLIDLLMDLHTQNPTQGYDALAIQASEGFRARVLLETLRDAHADIRKGVDPSLLSQERSLQERLNARSESRSILLNGSYTAEEARDSAEETNKLLRDFQQVEARIREASPNYIALTQPAALNLKEIQSQLDPDTLLLEYSLGNEKSHLWLVSQTGVNSVELPARRKIESVARLFRERMIVPADVYDSELAERGLAVSRMILGPVVSQLGEKRLLIVADGALQYLAFACLPDPSEWQAGRVHPLVLRHEIVNLPSMSVLATLRKELTNRQRAQLGLAVLADPVFSSDDIRVKKSAQEILTGQKVNVSLATLAGARAARESGAIRTRSNLERLLETRKEAESIAALLPPQKARKALDFEANRKLVISDELSRYRYLHFASHGLIDSLHPELTAIVLSLVDEGGNPQDGYLRAHEIYNLNLSADLVVLSACETALGKEIRGEGLIGLTRAFMYAGVPRVVTSLWKVKDESSAKLMADFYRGMIKEGRRPASALRAAQIQMLKSKKWAAPYYWAPFVLQGEWK